MDIILTESFPNRYYIKDGQVWSVSHCKPLHIYPKSRKGAYYALWDGSKVYRLYLKDLT